MVPGTVIHAFTTLAAPLFYYIAIYRLKLGVEGAATAFTLCNSTSTLLLAGYTAVRDWRRAGRPDATWTGPSAEALRGWGAYLALALPATVAIASGLLLYDLVIFLAGMLPDAEVAVGVMGLAFQISCVAYMSAMALSAAATTRVANELGQGAAAAARVSCWAALGAVLFVQSTLSAACLAAGNAMAALLSSDGRVQALAVRLMPVLAASFVGDGCNAVLQGVLRGAGRQALGAALNVTGYWLFGLPLTMVLGFKAGMGVLGFSTGLLIATSLQALLQACVIWRFDWDLEVARAAALVGALPDVEAPAGGGLAAAKSGGVGSSGSPLPEEAQPLLLDASLPLSALVFKPVAQSSGAGAAAIIEGGAGDLDSNGGAAGRGSLAAPAVLELQPLHSDGSLAWGARHKGSSGGSGGGEEGGEGGGKGP